MDFSESDTASKRRLAALIAVVALAPSTLARSALASSIFFLFAALMFETARDFFLASSFKPSITFSTRVNALLLSLTFWARFSFSAFNLSIKVCCLRTKRAATRASTITLLPSRCGASPSSCSPADAGLFITSASVVSASPSGSFFPSKLSPAGRFMISSPTPAGLFISKVVASSSCSPTDAGFFITGSPSASPSAAFSSSESFPAGRFMITSLISAGFFITMLPSSASASPMSGSPSSYSSSESFPAGCFIITSLTPAGFFINKVSASSFSAAAGRLMIVALELAGLFMTI
mmetsp:Transcript_81132/g.160805  ORF Transcript_81132/g.160805 Transcript_81132/m.160805 type:complete len:292 (+) Transcript_81132:640-1515(+)